MAPLPVLCAFVALAPAPQVEGAADPLRSALREAATRLLEEHRTPGLAMARLVDGELAWAEGVGFADAEAKAPVETTTVFNVGSISKAITAWGVLKLVEEGELDLEDPVMPWLERWQLPESAFDPSGVTVERLLSHTAGLSLHGYPGFPVDAELPSLEASLDGATGGRGRVELVSEPGTEWKYSGGGYTILQLLMEETTGRPFAPYMKEVVLDPLGMTSSDYRWTERILARAATPHDEQGRPFEGQRFTALAAAGLQTTVLDLARFAEASLALDVRATRGVLTPETVRGMRAPVPPGRAGLGYQQMGYYGIRTFGHGGSNDGWEAMLSIEPVTGDAIVLLSNGSNGEQVLRGLYGLWADAVNAKKAAMESDADD